MKFTDEDIEAVEKFSSILNRGRYCNINEVTDVYNRVLEKAVRPTNCSSCIRQRVFELKNALDLWKKQEAEKEQEKKE